MRLETEDEIESSVAKYYAVWIANDRNSES